jgi:hypothetical protein
MQCLLAACSGVACVHVLLVLRVCVSLCACALSDEPAAAADMVREEVSV